MTKFTVVVPQELDDRPMTPGQNQALLRRHGLCHIMIPGIETG